MLVVCVACNRIVCDVAGDEVGLWLVSITPSLYFLVVLMVVISVLASQHVYYFVLYVALIILIPILIYSQREEILWRFVQILFLRRNTCLEESRRASGTQSTLPGGRIMFIVLRLFLLYQRLMCDCFCC